MVWYTGEDKKIYDSGIHYRPQQEFLLTDYEWPTEGEGEVEGGGGGGVSYGIPAASVGGGGGTGPYDYTQTWTRDADWEYEPREPREGLMGLWDKTQNYLGKSKWFQPKIKGTLGDRLLGQHETMGKVPMMTAALAKLRSPFNPDSATYNYDLPNQLNFLEAGTGRRLTGTSGNLKWVDDQMMIGRDPNTGGLKYGPGSVLAGQNVISGFGTNDYEEALNKYIEKMNQRALKKQLTTFQKTKLKQAQDELSGWKGEQKIQDADKGIIHTDTDQVTDFITDQGKGGGADVWQETFSGTQDSGGEFAGTTHHGDVAHGPSGRFEAANTSKDYNQGGRVYLNLGGIASVLGTEQDRREGLAPGGPAGGASAGGNYGGNVNPEQEYAGSTFKETYGGEVPPTVVKDNFTVDTNLLTTSPSAEINYTPSQWAQIMARLSNEDVTSTDDINFEGQFTGGNNLIDYGIDFTDEGVTGGNVGLNYGDLNLQATTDLNRHNLGVNYNKGPFFVSGNIDNMGNKNVMGGVKWSFGEPDQAPVRSLSYKEENPDLIYGQNLRHGGLARLL